MSPRDYEREHSLPRFSLDRRIAVLMLAVTIAVIGSIAALNIVCVCVQVQNQRVLGVLVRCLASPSDDRGFHPRSRRAVSLSTSRGLKDPRLVEGMKDPRPFGGGPRRRKDDIST